MLYDAVVHGTRITSSACSLTAVRTAARMKEEVSTCYGILLSPAGSGPAAQRQQRRPSDGAGRADAARRGTRTRTHARTRGGRVALGVRSGRAAGVPRA